MFVLFSEKGLAISACIALNIHKKGGREDSLPPASFSEVKNVFSAVVPLLEIRSDDCHQLHVQIKHIHGEGADEGGRAETGSVQRNLR